MAVLFMILLCASMLLAFASIAVAVTMPRETELYSAWRVLGSVCLAAMVLFTAATVLDSLWWALPALSFAFATWLFTHAIRQVAALKEWDMVLAQWTTSQRPPASDV